MKFADKAQYLRYLVDRRGMKPIYMILGLTYDCNSFCRTCFNWEQLRKNKEHELSFEEILKTFASLDESALRRHERRRAVHASRPSGDLRGALEEEGGEADHDPDRRRLARSIARQAEQILEKCPATQIVVNISIDHVGEKHDWIRGVPGCYEKAKATYAKLVRSGPLPELHPQCAHVPVHLQRRRSRGADDVSVQARLPGDLVPLVRDAPRRPARQEHPADHDRALPRGAAAARAYWQTFPKYDGFLKFVKIYSRQVELRVLEEETQVTPCYAGTISGVIDARGEVRLCELREAVGNVRDTGYDFGKLWFSPEAEPARVDRGERVPLHPLLLHVLVARFPAEDVGGVFGVNRREFLVCMKDGAPALAGEKGPEKGPAEAGAP